MTNPQDSNRNIPEYGTPEYEAWYAANYPQEYADSRAGMTPTETPKKKHRTRTAILVGGAAVVAIIVGVSATGGGNDEKSGSDTKDKAAAVETTVKPASEPTTDPTTAKPTQAPTTKPAPPATTKAPPPKPKPKPKPQPKPAAPAVAAPVVFSGSGDDVIAIHKPAGDDGAVVLTATYTGDSNFVVQTPGLGDDADAQLLVNTIGSYSGSVLLDPDTQDTKQLQISAAGPWTIKLSDIKSMPQFTSGYNGTGDTVLIYTGGAGAFTFNHPGGDGNFVVESYGSDYPDLLINEIGAYSGTVPADGGPLLVTVTATGAWSVASK